MATINGTSFNLKTFSISTVHRNRHIPIVGSDNNVIEDYGYDGLSIDISGSEYSQSDYNNIIAEFMQTGEQKLIISPGWEYRVHSVRLNRTGKPGYAADLYYPYSLSMLTRAPYQFSTEAHIHAHTITSNNQEWDDENAVGSLLKNADFENWNSGTSSVPDYWLSVGPSTSRTTDSKYGTYACLAGGGGGLSQTIPVSNFSKDTAFVTFGAWVKSAYSTTYIMITVDGLEWARTFHSGSGIYEWLEITKQLNPGETVDFSLVLELFGSTTAIIDCAVVVEGESIYGTDHLFADDIVTNGTVDTPVDVEITASPTPSTATATISQTEGC